MKKTTQNAQRKIVFLAMSGGVDSSVSAAILKEQGYNVVGVYMKNWSGDNYGIQTDCPWEQDQEDVENVCKMLNIPFMSFNFEKEYRKEVVDYFFREYKAGRTPNPDVMCNKEIKFGRFLKKAVEKGADFIATGHYARVKQTKDGKYHLLKGRDKNKDQSYFLYNLTQEQLSKTLFPIGDMNKSEVRKLAKKFNLPNAEKKDSQGICFIGDIDVQKFLRKAIKKKKGKIVDIDTKEVVGVHDGIYYYTVGQREGLKIGGTPEPYFVAGKDGNKNELYVAMGQDNPALFSDELKIEGLNWINEPKNENVEVSIRYRQTPQKAKLTAQSSQHIDNGLIARFDKPQRAITEGQSAVIYQGEECLGGGVISNQ